jgi:hypothetical protein
VEASAERRDGESERDEHDQHASLGHVFTSFLA